MALPGVEISNLPEGGAAQSNDLIGIARLVTPGVYTNVKIEAIRVGAIVDITGTNNQILVNGESTFPQTGEIKLSLVQDIAISSSPEFFELTIGGLTPNRLISTNSSNLLESVSDLTNWVIGTPNRISSISNGIGATTIDIDVGYIGQTSITTLGTLTSGTWNASIITGQYGGTGIANTGKTITLGGNLTTSGSFNAIFTLTADTSVTFPTSGTLATTTNTVSSITGSANQVLANGTTGSAQTGSVTLTLPQSIATSSTVEFENIGINSSSPLSKLDVYNTANSASYNEIAYFRVSNNAGGTNYSLLRIVQNSVNHMAIEAADQSNAKGNLLLQPFGGFVGIGDTVVTAGNRLQVTLNSSANILYAGGSNSGSTNEIICENTINSGASSSRLHLKVGGTTSTGDPYIYFDIPSGGGWTMGSDNSVSGDNFVLSASSSLGTANVISIDGVSNNVTLSQGLIVNGQTLIGSATAASGNSPLETWTSIIAEGPRFISTGTSGVSAGAIARLFCNDGNALASGDRIGAYLLGGATNSSNTLISSCSMESFATEAWSGTAAGSNFVIKLCPNTSITRVERFRINQNGYTSIGSIADSPSILQIYQNGTETGSDAGLTIEQDGTGDSVTQYLLTADVRCITGIDNSDSNKYKVAVNSSALGTNDAIVSTTSGEITFPLTPLVLAYNSATDTSVTGDGTVYTIIFDTVITDQNSDYNNSTGTFTAPVTGKYEFGAWALLTSLGAGHSAVYMEITTTGNTFRTSAMTGAGTRDSGNNLGVSSKVICPMSATDTCVIKVFASGSTKTVGVGGTASPIQTYFYAALVA